VTRIIWLVVIDLSVVIAISVAIGAWAPRWPAAWLGSDPALLRRLPWETPEYFRRLRVSRWATRLPELGDIFGGQRKDALPGATTQALNAYLVEVRRAEWVHWGSILGSLILFAFNPWWLAAAFVLVVIAGNTPFLLILRNNRFRIVRILDRESRNS
jgi:glycosyl-4,4'-diaponeurosporenoate acyltransferase